MANARDITICIDMGMTGSVAKWRTSAESPWQTTGISKIQTCLAYDPQNSEGPPIAWGRECEELPRDQIKEYFKEYMRATSFSGSQPNTAFGAPSSQRELLRWIRDYLSFLCADLVSRIDEQTAPGWRDETVTWNFTVPGSWTKSKAADFRRVAGNAVSALAPNSCISASMTEATASAVCLLATSAGEMYSVGNAVISCDIGGATTDIAVSSVSGAGRLIPWHQLQMEPVGTVTVEKEFWTHAHDTLKRAGARSPAKSALTMVRSPMFRGVVSSFTKHQSSQYIIFPIPEPDMHDWPPSQISYKSLSKIENQSLYVHRDVFESFFMQLAEQIEAALDEAVNMVAERKSQPNTIGFCGGGSRISYLVERLERRYGDTISITRLANMPEMATVIGSTLIWEQTKLLEFISQTSFGVETDNGIRWRSPEENLAPSKFSEAYPWTVTFDCNKRGKFNTHKVLTVAKVPKLPGSYSEALKLPQFASWTIQVDLQNVRGGLLRNKRYQVICNISGPRKMDFRAESLADGESIPCGVTRGAIR